MTKTHRNCLYLLIAFAAGFCTSCSTMPPAIPEGWTITDTPAVVTVEVPATLPPRIMTTVCDDSAGEGICRLDGVRPIGGGIVGS